MSYYCKILADSVNPVGNRLTTFEVTFPQMVLRDITRHRMLSYSFESTRAVPVEKRIEMVRKDPYVPTFMKRAKGMGGGEHFTEAEQQQMRKMWLMGARQSADLAELMLAAGKEHVGRILEPYSWITGIISGTDWENFFGLRCPPIGGMPDPRYPAQYELQYIAWCMEGQYRNNVPVLLKWGEWHLPLVTEHERQTLMGMDRLEQPKVSAGRCASVSFLRHHDSQNDNLAAYNRWEERLAPSAHWSPGEHPAMAERGAYRFGNFKGWKQLRKFYPNEAVYLRDKI